jgi:hypothetical protein
MCFASVWPARLTSPDGALLHLVGQSRAFLLQLDSVRNETGSMYDARPARLVEAIGLTLLGRALGATRITGMERAKQLRPTLVRCNCP